MTQTRINYEQVQKADKAEDAEQPPAIQNALTTSVTQEDIQVFTLSRLREIIFGTDTSQHWYTAFESQGILPLKLLSLATTAGATHCIRFPVTTAASQASVTGIPAGAVVTRAFLDITSPFSSGTLISVGQVGNLSLLMGTPYSFPEIVNQYEVDQNTLWGVVPVPVIVTVTGAPTVGAGTCYVEYTLALP